MLIVGNWKMNGSAGDLAAFRSVAKIAPARASVEVVLCPPFTLLAAAVDVSGLTVGAQDCHHAVFGSHTGCVSASMIKATGAEFVLIGHSETREQFGDTHEIVAAKAVSAVRADLTPIICVGETACERAAGDAKAVLAAQLRPIVEALTGSLIIAYEPIWAIGTGRLPANHEIEEIFDFLRTQAGERIRILYGGSVDSENTSRLCEAAGIDGLLVGGSSLDPATFRTIVLRASRARRSTELGAEL